MTYLTLAFTALCLFLELSEHNNDNENKLFCDCHTYSKCNCSENKTILSNAKSLIPTLCFIVSKIHSLYRCSYYLPLYFCRSVCWFLYWPFCHGALKVARARGVQFIINRTVFRNINCNYQLKHK